MIGPGSVKNELKQTALCLLFVQLWANYENNERRKSCKTYFCLIRRQDVTNALHHLRQKKKIVENKSSKNIDKIINLYKISAGDEPIPFLVENSKSLPYLCSYLNIWLIYISLNPFKRKFLSDPSTVSLENTSLLKRKSFKCKK